MALTLRSIGNRLRCYSRLRLCTLFLGVLSSFAVLAMWGVSEYRCIRYWSVHGKLTTLCPGAIEWQYEPLAILCGVHGFSAFGTPSNWSGRWWIRSRSVRRGYHFSIPLWMFLVPCLAATSISWPTKATSLDRCNRCDYDLTGNESGICPECGAAK